MITTSGILRTTKSAKPAQVERREVWHTAVIVMVSGEHADTPAKRAAGIALRSAVPTFLVPDVNATAEWYATHLGFATAGMFPSGPPASWASLQRDGAEIMLQRLPGYQKPDLYQRRPGGVWDAYIRMTGVHAFYETLRHQPFIKMPLTRQPYGDWEFEVVDLNGYVLVFGGDETLDSAPPPES